MLIPVRGVTSDAAPEIILDNLAWHLDVGNASSYSGSGQNWLDLTANNLDFHLGADGSSGSDDPTYNAGPPAYFSGDGGDWFKSQAAYSGSILRTMGRSNQPFTFEAWMYVVASAGTQYVFSSSGGSGDNGVQIIINSAEKLTIIFNDGGNGASRVFTSAANANAWNQLVIVGQADGGSGAFYLNGAADGTWSYSSAWGSGDSTRQVHVWSWNAGVGGHPVNGSRAAIFRAYSDELTAGEVLQNYDANKGRFGL